jgi:CBS domain-containing protein
MSAILDVSTAPFDRLTPEEIEILNGSLDVAYFRPNETIIAEGAAPEGLYIVIKGCVEERAQGELMGLLGPKDFFDSRALVQGAGVSAFIAREETLCSLAPRADLLRLINGNPRFGAFFYIDISRKLDALAQRDESSQIEPMMRARVGELFLLPAAMIDADATIASAGRIMRDIDCNALLVRDGDRTGIITGMNLSKAVVLKGMTIDETVKGITQFEMVTVAPDDFVSQALLLMTKHNKRRLVVKEGEEFVGILEDINLLSFFAGNSQLVVGRIDRATNLPELAAAAAQISGQLRPLRRQGVKFEVVAEIVSDLNRRLFHKLFELLCPEEMQGKTCLIVMGSEGRGEQTIRTDQDNGLILSEPVDEAKLQQFRDAFSGALAEFGFPPCPGRVMVNNPLWSRTIDQYIADFSRWTTAPDEQSAMNVAIFYDAEAVAGDASLLLRAKKALVEKAADERVFLGRFARAIESFEPPIGLFNTLKTAEGDGDALDLKKGGIFPIVHGVRSLAIERGLTETNTVERLHKLGELGVLKPNFARDLARALNYLMTLRLDAQLSAQLTSGPSGSLLRPATLTSMDRDLLRDSFQVVKQLRDLLRHHFKTNMF